MLSDMKCVQKTFRVHRHAVTGDKVRDDTKFHVYYITDDGLTDTAAAHHRTRCACVSIGLSEFENAVQSFSTLGRFTFAEYAHEIAIKTNTMSRVTRIFETFMFITRYFELDAFHRVGSVA